MEINANSIFHFSTYTSFIEDGEIQEDRDGGYHLPNAKKLNFLENSELHSFIDGKSRQFDERVAFASILMTRSS
jgi:hypothetical protein